MTTFLSCSLFLNRNLMKIKGFLSKQSGARDLRAKVKVPLFLRPMNMQLFFYLMLK